MPEIEAENHSRDLATIKDWLCKQPHLPHEVDEILLRRFLSSCHYSMERTKRTIDFFFTLRSTAPELFCKRDPWAPEIQRVFQITDMIPLPSKTKENYKCFIYRLNTPELDLFSFVDAVKTFFMLADTRLTEDDDIPAGEIPIFDAGNVSIKFIGKINLSVLRKYMLYTQEAIPIRLKQVHIINAPAYIGKIHAICKPFLKAEVAKLVHIINAPAYIGKIHAICKPFLKAEVAKLIKFHEPNSTTLYSDIPLELLPNEYGGKAGTIEQIKRHWIKRIEAKRDWFLTNDKRWAVDESLRPSNCRDERTDKVRDLPGSFRSLALD